MCENYNAKTDDEYSVTT